MYYYGACQPFPPFGGKFVEIVIWAKLQLLIYNYLPGQYS